MTYQEVSTHRELWGKPFPIGMEWDAGYIMGKGATFLVFVRRTEDAFVVFLRSYPPYPTPPKDEVVKRFSIGEDEDAVEREAKIFALKFAETLRQEQR